MTDVSETDLNFIRRAIDLAVAAVEEGNRPFASVLVAADGAVLAEDCDRTNLSGDPMSHSEVNVIRTGIQKHGIDRLAGATIYVSGEPCSMCAGTILRNGIARVLYGAPGEVTGPYLAGKRLGQRYPSAGIFALAGDKLKVTSGVLLEDARRPLELYVAKGSP